MLDIAKIEQANLQRWQRVRVNQDLIPLIDKVAGRLVAAPAKAMYQKVEAATGVPWAVIAVIHQREASQSWKANLAQGDPWNKPSIHVPRGRGPFKSWEAAAVDALTNCPPRAAQW